MKVVSKLEITTMEKRWGITDVDTNQIGKQMYPYDTEGEANAQLDLILIERNPPKGKAKGFVDPDFRAALKKTGRI
jgi:hypothetical protein